MEMKAKDFKGFWIIAAAGAVFALGYVLMRARVVSGMTAMPDRDIDVMLYLMITERKSWLSGIRQTLLASVLGTLIGFAIAIVFAFVRCLVPSRRNSRPVQYIKYTLIELEKFYVTIVRGTPMMVQGCIIYYAGFGITKSLMQGASITEVNRVWSLFTAALITVFLNSAAYLAEVLRGGIDAVAKGQKEAAASLGFTLWQSMTRIIFPQAVRYTLPSIVNELINNIKGTSVLTAIGFGELMFATTSIAGKTYQYLPAYLVSAVLYLLLVIVLSRLLNHFADGVLQKKYRRTANG